MRVTWRAPGSIFAVSKTAICELVDIFQALSTGVYGYPMEEVAKVSSKAVKEFLSSDTSIQEVRLVFFSRGDSETFLKNHALT